MGKNWIFSIVISVLLIRCNLPTKKAAVSNYFQLDSLITAQMKELGKGEREVKKSVVIGGQSESKVISSDSLLWSDEFGFLEEFNPAKPRYVNAFKVSLLESQTTYQQKEEGQPGLQSFVVSYNSAGEIQRIKADIWEETNIYSSNRELKMKFQNGTIRSYELSGFQKMTLMDTVFFSSHLEIAP